MFFAFPEDARWNADRQAVEFGVEIGEYRSVVRVPRRVFQRLLPERPTPERCVGACHLLRTRFESIAERKLRRRQLTEDGNVEISGRDLPCGRLRFIPLTGATDGENPTTRVRPRLNADGSRQRAACVR
jgi:hypothetical protein